MKTVWSFLLDLLFQELVYFMVFTILYTMYYGEYDLVTSWWYSFGFIIGAAICRVIKHIRNQQQ